MTDPALRAGVGLVSFLQIGVAVAVICITYFKLSHINSFRVNDWKHIGHAADAYYNGTQPYSFDGRCWLDSNTASGTACVYAYALAGVSLLATMIVSAFLCITCNLCGCGPVFEFLFGGAACAWWIIGAIYLMAKGHMADSAGVPNHDWRTSVWVLAYVNGGLFGLFALLSLIRAFQMLCGCCEREKRPYY